MDLLSVLIGASVTAIVLTVLYARKNEKLENDIAYYKQLTIAYEQERLDRIDKTANLDWAVNLFNERNKK